ncbi:MAG TPA: TIGR02281 family clan AA aspartic protease [Gammaproteobacteria bacterium]|nr:TIGR02281 family clan AA aspartic protease [Gammaproteobacteria bacterium]
MMNIAQTKLPGLAAIFLCVVSLLLATPASAIKSLSVYVLFNGRAILVIDGQQRMLQVGETSPEGVSLISSTTHSAIVEIDGEQEEIGLHIVPSIGPVSEPGDTEAESYETTVTLEKSSNGFFHAEGEINNKSVSFLIDTGANNVAMSVSMARSLDIDFESGRKSLASTANGLVPMYEVVLEKVTVGSIELDNISAAIISDPGPNEILLGMSFLGQLEVNHSGNTMVLTQR